MLAVKKYNAETRKLCPDNCTRHLYAQWRIIETTGAGWFHWPGLYASKEAAEKALAKVTS